ncbi:MAG: META domain-containing protein [Bacteroidota bacterium]
MKTIFFIMAICVLAVDQAGAVTQSPLTEDIITHNNGNFADTVSLNGQWFLQPLLASDTAAGKFPILRFNLAAGAITGNTGCNSMRGSFKKTDSSLVFDQNLVTTKMNCTGYDEAAFLKSLLHTNRYRIENGVLILMFDKAELSRWTRKPDRSIKIRKT